MFGRATKPLSAGRSRDVVVRAQPRLHDLFEDVEDRVRHLALELPLQQRLLQRQRVVRMDTRGYQQAELAPPTHFLAKSRSTSSSAGFDHAVSGLRSAMPVLRVPG